jgi:hypothetical protein
MFLLGRLQGKVQEIEGLLNSFKEFKEALHKEGDGNGERE